MMMRRHKSRSRRGAALVEAAVVYPVFLLFLLGTMVLGLGVFRYGQLSSLTWEGARWASVRGPNYQDHGPNYQAEAKHAAPTDQDVITNLDWRMLFGLSPDDSGLASTLEPDSTTVTLGYEWRPEYNPTVGGQASGDPSSPPRRLFNPVTPLSGATTMPTLYFRTDGE